MCRGIGDPLLVTGTRCHYQSSKYPRQMFWQIVSREWTNLSKQNGHWINQKELHFPNAQLPQCGSVWDTLQSQTPIVCISSSRQSGLSDRHIIYELESSSCLCISSNNSDTFCSSQDMSVSVQNSSYCPLFVPNAQRYYSC